MFNKKYIKYVQKHTKLSKGLTNSLLSGSKLL